MRECRVAPVMKNECDEEVYHECTLMVRKFNHPTKRHRLRCRECGGLYLDSTWLIDGRCVSCDYKLRLGGAG